MRVVSMPSTAVFDRQSKDYRDSVLPQDLPTVAVEAGSTDLWYKYWVAMVLWLVLTHTALLLQRVNYLNILA